VRGNPTKKGGLRTKPDGWNVSDHWVYGITVLSDPSQIRGLAGKVAPYGIHQDGVGGAAMDSVGLRERKNPFHPAIPLSLLVAWLLQRRNTPKRGAISARLLMSSTPGLQLCIPHRVAIQSGRSSGHLAKPLELSLHVAANIRYSPFLALGKSPGLAYKMSQMEDRHDQ